LWVPVNSDKEKKRKKTRTNVSMSHTTVLSSLPKIRESFEENIMCIKRLYAVYDEKKILGPIY